MADGLDHIGSDQNNPACMRLDELPDASLRQSLAPLSAFYPLASLAGSRVFLSRHQVAGCRGQSQLPLLLQYLCFQA
ncbi:hypothetical protein WJX73_009478 [Symbiochloris irregularis]|uniref:Uncharacterized protein n=1 Tax=Symbiochloris irregularis TaxID=706552 RepID=A0AAW1NW23_9CHLO